LAVKKKVAIWICAVALAPPIGYAILNALASLALERELESITAAGEPLLLSELAPEKVPDADNAFLVFQKAVAAVIKAEEEVDLKVPVRAMPSRTREHVKGLVETNSVAFELMAEAEKFRRAWLPFDYHSPYDSDFPKVSGWTHLARLNAARIQILAEAGDIHGVVSAVEQGLALSESLLGTPTLIVTMVGHVCDDATLRALEIAVQSVSLTAVQRAKIAERLQEHSSWQDSMAKAVMAERCWGIASFRALSAGQRGGFTHEKVKNRFVRSVLRSGLVLKLDEICYLRLMQINLDGVRRATTTDGQFMRASESLPFYAHIAATMTPLLTNRGRTAAEIDRKADRLRAQLEAEAR
jgi:hypothetical protein